MVDAGIVFDPAELLLCLQTARPFKPKVKNRAYPASREGLSCEESPARIIEFKQSHSLLNVLYGSVDHIWRRATRGTERIRGSGRRSPVYPVGKPALLTGVSTNTFMVEGLFHRLDAISLDL